MSRLYTFLSIFVFSVFALTIAPPVLAVKDKDKKRAEGTPVLWRQPVIRSRNLRNGPGGPKPNLRQVTFIEDETGGYSKKYRVRDGAGREWVAKIGKEAQAETAAVRLLWAVGYPTEINYLEPTSEIVGKGTFQNVRFEARPNNIKRLDEWKWEKNPFVGTRELQGLKVMMALLNNWDIKDSNNNILSVPTRNGNQLQYIISDLGATFGKSSGKPVIWLFTRSRNNPQDYAKAKLVDEVDGNKVDFAYDGKRSSLFDDITVGQARWIGGLLSQLSNQQIRDAFIAANYSPSEAQVLTSEVRNRINELMRLRAERNSR